MPLTLPPVNGVYIDLVTMTPGSLIAHYSLATITSGAVIATYPDSGNATYKGVASYDYTLDTASVGTVAQAVIHVQQVLAALILSQEGLDPQSDTVVFAR
jgi:hypothetical protein